MANNPGERIFCGVCNSEFVVTRGAEGMITCCGNTMTEKKK